MKLPRNVWPDPLAPMPLLPPAMTLAVAELPVPLRVSANVVAPHGGVRRASPEASSPKRFPDTAWADPPVMLTPDWQAARRLRAAGVAPPIVAFVWPATDTWALNPWSIRVVPAASVPRKQPSTLLFEKAPKGREIPVAQ